MLRDPSGVVQEKWYGGRPDCWIDGLNIELSNRLTPVRAPGSTAYSTTTFASAVTSFYPFKQFTTASESITLMADTPATIYTLNPTSKSSILTKAAGAGPAYFLGVGNTLYIGDGAEQVAWTGIGTVRKWGIAQAPGAGANAALYAGVGANGSGTVWANPTYIEGAPDTNYATQTLSPISTNRHPVSGTLLATDYAFAITGQAAGVQVAITGHIVVGGSGLATSPEVFGQLLLNGTPAGTAESAAFNSSTDVSVTLGGPSDLWGNAALSAAAVNGSAGIGFQLQATAGWASGTPTVEFFIDSVQIVVYYIGPVVGTPTGSGSLATVDGGWKYVYEYANSASGAFSQASPPGAATGNFSGKAGVTVPVLASADPQVNQIWVFRTLDGGSTEDMYALPSNPYPNTSATITDTALDSQLLEFTLADVLGANTPPPAGLTAMEYYQGRIWGAVGNVVYYSSGSDLGFIAGNGNEGFPPANYFTFPSKVVKLLGVTLSEENVSLLVVFTTSDVYAIYGNGSALAALAGAGITPYFAAPLLRKIGLSSFFAADARGAIVYMMTSDGRVISFNPASQTVYLNPEQAINEIGFAIGAAPQGITLQGGTLASFNPASAYVNFHSAGSADQALYVADGSTGWFRCNPNQQPDGGAVWSAKRNITGGCQAVQSIETSPGVWQLLIGPGSGGGSVYYRDPTQNSDGGTAYPAWGRMGALILAQPGQTASVSFVACDFAAGGSQPAIKTLLDEVDGTFIPKPLYTPDPPQLTAAASVYNNRYDMQQAASGSGTQEPVECRWMQIWFDFGSTDTVQNEMLSLTVFGSYEQEA